MVMDLIYIAEINYVSIFESNVFAKIENVVACF